MSTPVEPVIPKSGRTTIIGMTVVILGLGAFYRRLHNKEQRRMHDGSNAFHEQRLAHAGSIEKALFSRPASFVENRALPLGPISRENNSKHSTIKDYLASPGYSEEGRRMQPTPQRAKKDGSGRAYTKSPDYVDSYEKTPKYYRKARGGELEANA
ncbi:hypothetical protein HGRIS_011807 [Hohenbuehelia grisea]|uniref:Uncharacterized protein n=1 Tax=Hohenbuehelia grisea TaxID=104357 RepID=A0ABR3JXZ2_9AGAR